jgi:hypothetical protein
MYVGDLVLTGHFDPAGISHSFIFNLSSFHQPAAAE